ncbi:MAG: radical SAM protein [Chloroflexi bacterium]|jgi:radical SAM protein with 4Fe4S-binding SPASM domain|nr:radical SAM protein [Chloroflexota bacterium]MBT4003347.1 radical SAM protein [Chloroflexota bacterium]MBT4305879.1 radical SAM protein [Chloroflexota bacterium]MBT4533704.1 radical SAM protein [Chloroflexota bacterium]MBT4681653.1 radical SAM protein [Chloroflexota bacterium]
MLNINEISSKVGEYFKSDIVNFGRVINGVSAKKTGLFTYSVFQDDGREMRIHLRKESDGNGILFIDVTDVIHLNSTATDIAQMALEGHSKNRTKNFIFNKYSGIDKNDIDSQISNIFNMIDHFKVHSGDCYTCGLSSSFEMAPLFSLNVNAPFKVDIALTYGCNNNCPHCYNEADRFSLQSLELEKWKIVIDKIVELGVPHLILTGGEATLHPELPEIINYADSSGMIVGLNSNGRYLAHESYMNKLASSGLNHVQITLGSNQEEVHNAMMGAKSFKQTVNGIETAIDSGIHVITNTTLMRSNMDHAEEIIDFLYDLGIRTFAMNGMIYSGGGFADPNAITEKEMPALLVRVRDHAQRLGMRFLWYTPTEYCRLSPVELEIGAKRCNAGEYSMCIEPNGDVLPCQSYYVSAGNIINDPWEEIWQGELFRSFRERGDQPEFGKLPEKCWECPDLVLCGGGCRIEREARDGVRVSEDAGGGCSGCSGSCGTGGSSNVVRSHNHTSGLISGDGYAPIGSQIKDDLRSTGGNQLISKDDLFSLEN